jgi:hypothetical protein
LLDTRYLGFGEIYFSHLTALRRQRIFEFRDALSRKAIAVFYFRERKFNFDLSFDGYRSSEVNLWRLWLLSRRAMVRLAFPESP